MKNLVVEDLVKQFVSAYLPRTSCKWPTVDIEAHVPKVVFALLSAGELEYLTHLLLQGRRVLPNGKINVYDFDPLTFLLLVYCRKDFLKI